MISFRIDWPYPLSVQGTLQSLLQHHISKVSILWFSTYFMVQLSHPYMTTGKTIALTRQTFVGKVMSLLFNMLSRLVIAFLLRNKCLLISWLQLPSAVILEPPKIKSVTVSIVSPSICHEVMGPDAMIFILWMLSFKPAFSLSSFTFIKRLFSASSLSVINVVPSTYLRLLIFLLAILIPACGSSSLAFLMMCSCLLAKSLQSCLTLCDPIDSSPPGSPFPGIPQARTLEWVAISFSNAWKWKVKVKSLSHVWLLATPWTAAYQAPLSMGSSRQEYWSGMPSPSPVMYSAFKLNKQGDNIQPWRTPFPIWNQSVVSCPVLTVVSWPAYRLCKKLVRCSGILISLRIFQSLLWSTQSKALV